MDGLYWCFYALLFLATLITLGAFYRIAIILYTIIFTYVFLIDQAYYLNHFYLEILLATLLCFMPAHRYFSLDSYWNPKIHTTVISFWPVFLLRAQKEIFLFYAGFVKINYEWLHGMPLRIWLSGGSEIPLIDYLFKLEWMPYIASYGTIILHLVGAPLLLWKPTRIYIFCIYCVFHLVNSSTFEIGVFPFLTIAATTIFFAPDWPAKILKLTQEPKSHFHPPSLQIKKITIFLLTLWIVIQVLMPLRYLLYPGNVLWTREGHKFSWRMKIADAKGSSVFYVTNPKTKESWKFALDHEPKSQSHCIPEIILETAHIIQKEWLKEKGQNVEVRVDAKCSLNGRKPQVLIDPNVDLTKIEDSFKHKEWIMPFDQTMKYEQ